jgi:hypothetical protein
MPLLWIISLTALGLAVLALFLLLVAFCGMFALEARVFKAHKRFWNDPS